jgi:hypothetical protein
MFLENSAKLRKNPDLPGMLLRIKDGFRRC